MKTILAIILSLTVIGCATAQPLKKPQFTGNLISDIKANSAAGVTAKPVDLAAILDKLAAKGVADLQAADQLAAAVDPDTQKVNDPIAHACYPALIKFIGSLPKPPAEGTETGPALVFERARMSRKLVQAGLPDYLKIGCAPLVQDEANFLIKVLALVGVTFGTGGLALPALPGLLPALPLLP